MAKYIEKPTEFEAVQISTELLMPEWFKEAVNKGVLTFRFDDNNEFVVDLLPNPPRTTPFTAKFGDYILNNPEDGHIYVYEKDYFESHYQLVSST